MPRFNRTLNLPGFTIKKTEGLHNILHVVNYHKAVRCIHCKGDNLRKKARYERVVRHESVGLRQVSLKLQGYKYHCRSCGKYFRQVFAGILPYKRSTEALRKEIFHLHSQGVSQVDLSKTYRLSTATIERVFQDYYIRYNQELKERMCPDVLGIDEHFFSKKQGYATTFCDLKKHKIFDVVKGHSDKELRDYILSLRGRERVKVVCMDMSNMYRGLVRKYFPNARIVADRFHVVRLAGHMFMKTWQSIDPKYKNHRGMLAIMRKKPTNLTEKERHKLQTYLAENPAIQALYDFKQKLHNLFLIKQQTRKQCRRHIPILLKYIRMLKESGFEFMRTLGKTLERWQEEIATMWRFTKNNGITEGFHRKMKLIQRRAYGFRNFENYRLRVRILCG
jgi:transposase